MMLEHTDDAGRRSVLAGGAWSDEAQYLYSVLWSAFLDLDFYTTKQALKRFRPYSTEWVAKELLGLTEGAGRDRGVSVRLADPFEALATWVVAPRLFGDPDRLRMDGGRTRPAASQDDAVRHGLRERFERYFRVPVAYRRGDVDAQSPLPPLPDLGIGPATIDTIARRGAATATMRSSVQVPYDSLRKIVEPANWGDCQHFVMSSTEHSGSCEMDVRLPGGAWNDDVKQRRMRFEYETFTGAFESRIDYSAAETDASYPMPLAGERVLTREEEADDAGAGQYSPKAVHVGAMRGFLSVEKMKGRPGWSDVVAERTVSFESPNHDRFKVETLMFWHVIELMSFVLARREQPKVTG